MASFFNNVVKMASTTRLQNALGLVVILGFLYVVLHLNPNASVGNHLSFFNRPVCDDFDMVLPGTLKNLTYVPSRCFLPHLTVKRAAPCLAKKGIRRIGILGDSQAWRYATVLQRFLPDPVTIRQKEVLHPERLPDAEYFSTRNATNLQVIQRECSGCPSFVASHGKPGWEMTLDVVTMEFLKDEELSSDDEEGSRLSTTQEFIARHWWRPPYTPQLVLHFSGLGHDVHHDNLETYSGSLAWHLSIWDRYLPDTTFLMFNSHVYNKDLIPPKYKDSHVRHFQSFNAIWYDVVRRRVKNGSNFIVGPDLGTISSLADKNMYLDAAHFKPAWYNLIIDDIVLPIFCHPHAKY